MVQENKNGVPLITVGRYLSFESPSFYFAFHACAVSGAGKTTTGAIKIDPKNLGIFNQGGSWGVLSAVKYIHLHQGRN